MPLMLFHNLILQCSLFPFLRCSLFPFLPIPIDISDFPNFVRIPNWAHISMTGRPVLWKSELLKLRAFQDHQLDLAQCFVMSISSMTGSQYTSLYCSSSQLQSHLPSLSPLCGFPVCTLSSSLFPAAAGSCFPRESSVNPLYTAHQHQTAGKRSLPLASEHSGAFSC